LAARTAWWGCLFWLFVFEGQTTRRATGRAVRWSSQISRTLTSGKPRAIMLPLQRATAKASTTFPGNPFRWGRVHDHLGHIFTNAGRSASPCGLGSLSLSGRLPGLPVITLNAVGVGFRPRFIGISQFLFATVFSPGGHIGCP